MNAYLKTISPIFVVAGLLTNCASGPDLGDSIAARGDSVNQIGKDYRRGESLVRQGEKNIRKGRSFTDKGQQQVRDGRRLLGQAQQDFCTDVQYSDPACQ